MSRGRKSSAVLQYSSWQNYYIKNISSYLQLIINGLVKFEDTFHESNFKNLESTLKNKGKTLNKVKDNEILFEIPKNWFWAKLPDVCEISTGSKDVNEGHPEGVYSFFTCAQEPLKSNTYSFEDDCILLPGNGANVGLVNRYKGKFELYQRTYCLNKINEIVSVDFLELYLRGFWKNNLGQQFGSGINYLRISNFTQFTIPIPPKEIQSSIINFMKDFEKNNLKSEGFYFNHEIENKIVSYHKSQIEGAELSNELSHQLNLVKKLRKQLLQDAVQGKLVEQNKKDEPASELLKKIKAEKVKLIAEKKLKNEKELPPIKPEEIPFEIPENWVWCRLGALRDIQYSLSYGVLVPGNDVPNGIPLIRVQDLDNAYKNELPIKKISHSTDKQYSKTKLVGGEILICVVGSIGKVALSSDNWIGANIARAVCRYMPNQNLSRQFLFYCLTSPFIQNFFQEGKKSINPTLNVNILETTLIPLPPIEEQNRIVQKLEELMQNCNELEASIKESELQNEKLLQQVLREALKGGNLN